jgi:hypothetical protein
VAEFLLHQGAGWAGHHRAKISHLMHPLMLSKAASKTILISELVDLLVRDWFQIG